MINTHKKKDAFCNPDIVLRYIQQYAFTEVI